MVRRDGWRVGVGRGLARIVLVVVEVLFLCCFLFLVLFGRGEGGDGNRVVRPVEEVLVGKGRSHGG